MAKVKTTMSQVLLVLMAITLILVIINLGLTIGVNKKLETGATKKDNPTPTQQPQTQPSVKVSIDDDAVKGSSTAKVTIIEFSDYQCPFCGRYSQQTYPSILKEYIEKGKVKYVFRDFPLSFHENAQKAAEAAECAGEQGKYYEMHDKLFSNQGALDVESLKKYAAELGLDTEKFSKCLDSGAMESEVKKDFADGQSYGVSGTPTFFIGNDKNGYQKLVGAQPFDNFKSVIEAELAKVK